MAMTSAVRDSPGKPFSCDRQPGFGGHPVWGDEGSNPSSSTGESPANLTSSIRVHPGLPILAPKKRLVSIPAARYAGTRGTLQSQAGYHVIIESLSTQQRTIPINKRVRVAATPRSAISNHCAKTVAI
jgi:hypothetical protein